LNFDSRLAEWFGMASYSAVRLRVAKLEYGGVLTPECWRKPPVKGAFMVKYTHGWQSLHAAMHTLAGASELKQRLESAIIFNLVQIRPDIDLPEEIRDDFIGFMHEMHSRRTRDTEGAVWDVIERLDEVGRQRAVTRIIDFYDVVSRNIACNEGDAIEQKGSWSLRLPPDFDG
jgi:hypothetical protein